MAGGRQGLRGGIQALQELIAEHASQITVECLRHGVHVRDAGTRRLSWSELKAIVECRPASSPLAQAMDKDAIFYDPHFLMLGHVVNELAKLRYSMTADDNSPEFE